MDLTAKLTSKGQITLPKALRDAIGLETGDTVLFRVEDGRAVLAKIPDFLDLAGAFPLPPDARHLTWDEERARAWRKQAERL
jgi:antitoxin PrlF